jgi:hypothetical protein
MTNLAETSDGSESKLARELTTSEDQLTSRGLTTSCVDEEEEEVEGWRLYAVTKREDGLSERGWRG